MRITRCFGGLRDGGSMTASINPFSARESILYVTGPNRVGALRTEIRLPSSNQRFVTIGASQRSSPRSMVSIMAVWQRNQPVSCVLLAAQTLWKCSQRERFSSLKSELNAFK